MDATTIKRAVSVTITLILGTILLGDFIAAVPSNAAIKLLEFGLAVIGTVAAFVWFKNHILGG